MRFLVDENLSSPRLASRLRAQGHDPVLASDVGLLSVTDARVLIFAIAQAIPVLTRDSEDFEDLHDLVMAAVGHHAGILIVRFDNDPASQPDRSGDRNRHQQAGILWSSDSRSDSCTEPVAMSTPPEVSRRPCSSAPLLAPPARSHPTPDSGRRNRNASSARNDALVLLPVA